MLNLLKNLNGTVLDNARYIGEELRKIFAKNWIKFIASIHKNIKKLTTKL